MPCSCAKRTSDSDIAAAADDNFQYLALAFAHTAAAISLRGGGWYTMVGSGETKDLLATPLGAADCVSTRNEAGESASSLRRAPLTARCAPLMTTKVISSTAMNTRNSFVSGPQLPPARMPQAAEAAANG